MPFRPEHPEEPLQDKHAMLERALMAEFLASAGYDLVSVRALPPAQRDDLLRYAATYATLRLSEIQARAEYVHDITGSHH